LFLFDVLQSYDLLFGEGQQMSFQISPAIKNEFKRPPKGHNEEDELISDYCLPLLFHVLSESNIFTVLAAVLLEKKILFVSSNLHILSACVYVLTHYQSQTQTHTITFLIHGVS
jgi:hypothetical protein